MNRDSPFAGPGIEIAGKEPDETRNHPETVGLGN